MMKTIKIKEISIFTLIFAIVIISCKSRTNDQEFEENSRSIIKISEQLSHPKIHSIEYGISTDAPLPIRMDIFIENLNDNIYDSLVKGYMDRLDLYIKNDTITSRFYSIEKSNDLVRITVHSAYFTEETNKTEIVKVLKCMNIKLSDKYSEMIILSDNCNTKVSIEELTEE